MSRRAQTIRIEVVQPGASASRPDITAEALANAQVATGKRRARL